MNQPRPSVATKLELVTAERSGGALMRQLLAGFAVQFEGESHYVVRLTMFPSNPYYLCKNRDSHDNYTVFAKMVADESTGAIRFQNPVGSGKLLPEMKSYLEIRFPLLGTSDFMNLYPRT